MRSNPTFKGIQEKSKETWDDTSQLLAGLKVIVNQMFSKELTERRNNALIKRKEYLILHPDLQIKLDYPATLKSRRKGQNNKWLILEEEFKKKEKKRKKEPGIMSR